MNPLSSKKGGNNNNPAFTSKDYQIHRLNPTSSAKKTFDFGLTADLEDGSVAMNADEKVEWKWSYNSERMTTFE